MDRGRSWPEQKDPSTTVPLSMRHPTMRSTSPVPHVAEHWNHRKFKRLKKTGISGIEIIWATFPSPVSLPPPGEFRERMLELSVQSQK